MRKHRVNISKHLLNLKQETKINYQQFWNYLTLKHKQVLQNIAKKIWRFSKSEILIYNFEVPSTARRKNKNNKKKITHANAKCYAFHENQIVMGTGLATSTAALI